MVSALTQLIARVDGRAGVKEGTNVKLALDMNKAHFFDKETTLSILVNQTYRIVLKGQPLSAGLFVYIQAS